MEHQREQEIADRLCERYDEVFFFAMDSIYKRLHDEPNAPDIDIPRNLSLPAHPEQEDPKI